MDFYDLLVGFLEWKGRLEVKADGKKFCKTLWDVEEWFEII